MSTIKVAYVYSGDDLRPALKSTCEEMGFGLVISLSPADSQMPGFPEMAGFLLIATESWDPRVDELCCTADQLGVPVLFLWELSENGEGLSMQPIGEKLPPAMRDSLRLAVKEAFEYPERFVGAATLRS